MGTTLYLVLLILSLSFYWIYSYFKTTFSYWRKRNVVSDPPIVPFGSVTKVLLNRIHFGHKTVQMYRNFKSKGLPYAGFYILNEPMFLPIDIKIVKRVLATDFQSFPDRGIIVDPSKNPLIAHLFALPGDKWKEMRPKLSPTFTSGRMKLMFKLVVDVADEMVETCDKIRARGEPLNMKEISMCYTTDVIGSALLGINANALSNPEGSEFRELGRRFVELDFFQTIGLNLLFTCPKLSSVFNFEIFAQSDEQKFCSMVKDTIDFRRNNNVVRNDFIELMNNMLDQGLMTMDELMAQAFVFFLAGFETSANTVMNCLYELAKHKDVQDRVRAEIVSVLKKNDGNFTYESLTDMKYLEQVVSETLRMYPPVPILSRMCAKDYKLPGYDLVIEKGRMVIVPMLAIHYDPEFYPNPEAFDPERFTEENKANRLSGTYMPFGDGPRICIGMRFGSMQSKIGLVKMLTNFEFSLNAGVPEVMRFETQAFILAFRDKVLLDAKKISV